MKKILITTENLRIGGVETSLIALLRSIDYKETEVDLYVLEKGELFDEIPKDVNVNLIEINYKRNIITRVFKTLNFTFLLKKYKKTFGDKSYDAAIAYYGINNYSDLIPLAVKAKKRIVYVHNDFYGGYQNSKIKPIIKARNLVLAYKYNHYDEIVTVSESSLESFNKAFPKVNKTKKVIYNLIDYENIKKNSLINPDVVLNGKFKIVSIGRLVSLKNFDKLVLIISKLRKYDVKAYIIGYGEEYQHLKELIEKEKIGDKVILLGKRSNVYNILSQADLLLSLSSQESFSLTLLIASALGIPFITNPNNGANEVVKNILKEGIICKNENLCKLLKDILEGKEKLYKPKFNYNNYAKEVKKKIKEVI